MLSFWFRCSYNFQIFVFKFDYNILNLTNVTIHTNIPIFKFFIILNNNYYKNIFR